ncbi:hypothetical protein [Nocardiopsis chromatogenes]|uniref:hypothetical protein n=1 Tax=Nocardiopsis chromatogenes TaxID=280239 RepID=UPI00034DDA4C|nr:hypothetical protein [Nocardiopsis chromatogenes]
MDHEPAVDLLTSGALAGDGLSPTGRGRFPPEGPATVFVGAHPGGADAAVAELRAAGIIVTE